MSSAGSSKPHLAATDLPFLQVACLCADRPHIFLACPEQSVIEADVPHTLLLVALNLILAGLAETLLIHVVLQANNRHFILTPVVFNGQTSSLTQHCLNRLANIYSWCPDSLCD
jgi:hypothetical protein